MKKQLFLLSLFVSSLWATQPYAMPTEEELEMQDIHHFISTLALVKHYYLEDVENKKLIQNALEGMVAKLDPHSSYLDAEYFNQLQESIHGEFGGIGVEITQEDGVIKVISPIDDTPASKAGIKPHDLIVKIDDAYVKEIGIESAIQKIRGEKGTEVLLTIIRENENTPLTISVIRDVIKVKSVKSKVLEDQYGYLKLSTFQTSGQNEIINALQSLHREAKGPLKGLVLDLRNNPGGLLHVAVEIADLFLGPDDTKENDLIVFTKGKHPESTMHAMATDDELIDGVPIVILINEGSASASEIVAGALQDHKRALVVGEQSFGKGSVQTIIPTMNGEGAVKLTTALYYTPKGRSIQARGIIPDLAVSNIRFEDDQTEALAFTPIKEKDLQSHIKNANEPQTSSTADLTLAKEDYQLYQAINILKGMSMLKR